MKELLKTTYKGVKIEEVWCDPKTYTYFTTNLKAHDDPTVKSVNVFGEDLDHVKKEIDSRLKELGIEKL